MTETDWLTAAFFVYLASWLAYVLFFFLSVQKVKLTAKVMLVAAFLLHTVVLIIRWKVSGHAPFSNMYESLIFFSWSFVLSFLFFDHFFRISNLGFCALLLNLTLLVYALSQESSIRPLMPALQSNWMLLHVTACFLGYGAFGVSFLASLVYLWPSEKKEGESLHLEMIMYRSILFGFPLLTLGVASGAVWANEAWGTYWSWDPKETWALITWFVYALYLHLHLMKGWGGKKLAWLAFGGFLCVLFTYWGVSYLMTGLHSYA